MNDRKCDLFERIRCWPGDPPRRRSPPLPSVDFKTNSGRRGTDQSHPDARRTDREAGPDLILSENLTRAFRQTGKLHELLTTLDAALQQARVRVHIVESELAKIAEGGTECP